MRSPGGLFAAVVLALASPVSADAAAGRLAIPRGRLDTVLAALSLQTGITIGSTDGGVATAAGRGVHGRMAPSAALRRVLAGTGFVATPVGQGAFRIERAQIVAPHRRDAAVGTRPTASAAGATDDPMPTIVVSASKRDAGLLRYPGSVVVSYPGDRSRPGTSDVQTLASGLPILQATALGPGRNKVFVRGIADSSFVGPTRSPSSVYFGDVQLVYGGPDPNLSLYDVDRVEVLEGPQGALYGAGSIGGIIALTPRAPDLDTVALSASAAASATQNGRAGYDLAGMVNVPIVDGVVAVRLVGYRSEQGGYIDDLRRGLRDINGVTTSGVRGTLRLAPGDGWSVEVGGLAQWIDTPDAQYAQIGLPPLTRASFIAQPSSNAILFGRVVVTKDWDSGLRLVSATGRVRHTTQDRFDATRPARPTTLLAYDTLVRDLLFTQEVRLSRHLDDGAGWLVGGSYIDDNARIRREFGAPTNGRDITGVTNQANDLSAFGEASIALTPRLVATAGGRVTRTRTDGVPSFTRGQNRYIRGRTTTRATPTAAIDWLVTPRLAWFARYGEGFRTGGLAVAPGVGKVANFDPDVMRVFESGLRLRRSGAVGLSASIGVSSARWSRIQADLIDRNGFPYTTNVGDGDVKGVEGSVDWVPRAGLAINGAFFLNTSSLREPVSALSRQQGSRLPNTPGFAAAGGITQSWPGLGGVVTLGVSGRYVGRSRVGIGPMLDLGQGHYGTVDATAAWRKGPLGLSLALDNASNVRGNRFGLGNPFGVGARNQVTPVRPRTLVAGATIEW